MATFDQFAIKSGWNGLTGQTNFESFFKGPGQSIRVPLGATIEESMDFHGHAQGRKQVSLKFNVMQHEYLDDYVVAIFGDWNTLYANVTLHWKLRDNTWDDFNAVAHLPIDNENYEHLTDGFVIDLELLFDIVGLAT